MNKTATAIAAFVLGGVVGSGTTYIFMKKKIDKVTEEKEEEISSARDVYSKMAKDLQEEKKKIMEENEERKARYKNDINNYLNDLGYTEKVPHIEQVMVNPEEDEDFPKFASSDKPVNNLDNDIYLITQDDYGVREYDNGEMERYDNEILIYYHDGIVTDSTGNVIDNPKTILGNTVMELLPTYDSSGFTETYVRNDILHRDYLIDIAGCDFDE